MTFKGTSVPLVNRRQALHCASGIGLATAASSIITTPADAVGGSGNDARINGPYVDLRTKEGNMEAMGRIYGNTDAGVPKFGWYDGYVMGVAPGGPVKNICGFKGMSSSKLIPSNPVWLSRPSNRGITFRIIANKIFTCNSLLFTTKHLS